MAQYRSIKVRDSTYRNLIVLKAKFCEALKNDVPLSVCADQAILLVLSEIERGHIIFTGEGFHHRPATLS